MATATVLVVALAGCGGVYPGAAEPSSSAAATSEAAESPSGSPSETGVPAADGPRVSKGSLTLHFPQGYEPRKVGTYLVSSTGPEGQDVAVTARQSISTETLDESADIGADNGDWVGKPTRAEDVLVDGVEMWHFTGKNFGGFPADTYGVDFGGYDMVLYFASPTDRSTHEDLVASILASVRWK
jgi:hypothetical protein